jgi:hypothetical protein
VDSLLHTSSGGTSDLHAVPVINLFFPFVGLQLFVILQIKQADQRHGEDTYARVSEP